MQQAHLSLRRAGQSAAEYYQEARQGSTTFTWASFDQTQKIRLALQPMDPAKERSFFYADTIPHSLKKAEYLKLLEKTIATIKAQNWGKVVISRARFFASKLDPKTLFAKLCEAYPQLTVYLFSHPQAGTWCGATPETLLEKEGYVLKTMSLAGTRKIKSPQDFTAKEYHEQQLVTDFIESTLEQNNAVQAVQTAPVQETQAAQVAHLQSLIQAQVAPGFKMEELLQQLHPTPAVSGLPRQEAMDFIAQHENYSRQFYSGYFGLSQQQAAHYWVNLRCMQLFEKGFSLYAGGGITAQSIAPSEWQETEAKMETLLSVVNG